MLLLKRAGVLLLVAVLVLSLAVAVAGAKKKKKRKRERSWDSQITLVHPASTQFSGTVSSKLDACRYARLVTVFYTDPVTGQIQPLSVQRTDKDGRYQVSLPSPAYPGGYHATVDEAHIRAKKAPHFCRAARSGAVGVQ
jgi:hypothetical protein